MLRFVLPVLPRVDEKRDRRRASEAPIHERGARVPPGRHAASVRSYRTGTPGGKRE
ncbi:hypothetical protein [Paraburkholderia kururiensis]|uniref:Uncharacterized protein n=1 Tax=Paraburkholderia kururiensis TaxID=984307 RepID=A0ABZ0WFZ8_9BURK|nr:hypothetical protein [Paraburkholderia kururiensis]WQD76276.1 hypothetical protein U0042_19460 [Paraburkholderia kururiensis]